MLGEQAFSRNRRAWRPCGLLALVIALLIAPHGSFAVDGPSSDAEASMLESPLNDDWTKDGCEPNPMAEAETLALSGAAARSARVDRGPSPGHALVAVPPPEA